MPQSCPGGIPYMDGEVSGLRAESAWGGRLLAVKVKMTNQEPGTRKL